MSKKLISFVGKTEVVAIHKECDKKNRFYIIASYKEEELKEILAQLPKEYLMIITR